MIIETLRLTQFTHYLKPRQRDSHKNSFGHVLVIGGDYGFSGAPWLSAKAALRVGAGLVSVATRFEHVNSISLMCPEIMCHGMNGFRDLASLLVKATVIVLGPGLGQSSWAKKITMSIFKSKKILVVDADALNLLATEHLSYANWILTPHPGEAARLLHTTSEAIQSDRLAAVTALQKKYGGVSVLKGAGTLIAAENSPSALCEAGNPGMATAGMGDVLSGVIGGLIAQGIPSFIAAKLGVLIHAEAGDLAAKEGERGMIASDLFPYLRRLVNL